ncbi:AraC family transcriptional regulator [Zestomonas carbonaria]|nr:AraC family transcriptional regulator [Pseudomonas carbonaria]
MVARHGSSVRDYLAPHNISPDVVGDYEKKLSYKSLAQIFQGASHAMGMPHFGMELATRQGLKLLGPLHYLAQSAATVGDGMEAVLRYMRFYSPSILYNLERRSASQSALLCFENNLPSSLETPQIIEKSVLQGCLLVSELLGSACSPKVVLLRHGPQSDMAQYARYFACPVLFNRDVNAVVLNLKDLEQACVHHDPMLHSITRFYLDAHCAPDSGLHAEVNRQIRILLPKQRCNLEQVALALDMNARTLQRRLDSAGLDFEHQLDLLRRQLAEQLLCGSSLNVTQIASELGYRGITSFCRAHKRWFGMAPLEHRKRRGRIAVER